jgi:dCTP diphosphatase
VHCLPTIERLGSQRGKIAAWQQQITASASHLQRGTHTTMGDEPSIHDLTAALRDFAAERQWEQVHTPKNLVLALIGEVGELAAIFRWLEPAQSAEVMADAATRQHVEDEIADVFGYVLRLADVLGVSLSGALVAKLDRNAGRYSIGQAPGNSAKQPTFAAKATKLRESSGHREAEAGRAVASHPGAYAVRLRRTELRSLIDLYYRGQANQNVLKRCAAALNSGGNRTVADSVVVSLSVSQRDILLEATTGRRVPGLGDLVPLLKSRLDEMPPPPQRSRLGGASTTQKAAATKSKLARKGTRAKKANRKSTSVWTVSGGLPTLGRRR